MFIRSSIFFVGFIVIAILLGGGVQGSDIYSGPVPNDLDVRLQRRDKNTLPQGAIVKFQQIGRGKSPHQNYRWVLYEDGRWFLARRSSNTNHWQVPFDTPLPTKPTKTLRAFTVAKVKKKLEEAHFFKQAPYQGHRNAHDGVYYVITARRAHQVHEVIYEVYDPPPIDFILSIISYEHMP